jgi:hypothetical protein
MYSNECVNATKMKKKIKKYHPILRAMLEMILTAIPKGLMALSSSSCSI